MAVVSCFFVGLLQPTFINQVLGCTEVEVETEIRFMNFVDASSRDEQRQHNKKKRTQANNPAREASLITTDFQLY